MPGLPVLATKAYFADPQYKGRLKDACSPSFQILKCTLRRSRFPPCRAVLRR